MDQIMIQYSQVLPKNCRPNSQYFSPINLRLKFGHFKSNYIHKNGFLKSPKRARKVKITLSKTNVTKSNIAIFVKPPRSCFLAILSFSSRAENAHKTGKKNEMMSWRQSKTPSQIPYQIPNTKKKKVKNEFKAPKMYLVHQAGLTATVTVS